MRHFISIITLAALLLLAAGCTPGNKYNPEVRDLPACAFTLTADETRGTDHVLPWTISKDGRTDSLEESIDDMYVTAYNQLTLNVEPDAAGFQGVNVRSTNANIVRVTKVDDKHYSLSYIADGEATVEVWNGKSGSEQKTAFRVKAQKVIEVEKVIWLLDDKELECHLFKSFEEIAAYEKTITEEPYDSSIFPFSFGKLYDRNEWDETSGVLTVLHYLRFGRLVPENASARKVNFDPKYFFYNEPDLSDGKTRNWESVVLEDFGFTFNWAPFNGDVADLSSDIYLGADPACSYFKHQVGLLSGRARRTAFTPFEMQIYGPTGVKRLFAILYFG